MDDEVWHKILPLPIGTKVKIVRNTINRAKELGRIELVGRIGTVVEYVDDTWKKIMITDGYYPDSISREMMYVLTFKSGGRYAYRSSELEVV